MEKKTQLIGLNIGELKIEELLKNPALLRELADNREKELRGLAQDEIIKQAIEALNSANIKAGSCSLIARYSENKLVSVDYRDSANYHKRSTAEKPSNGTPKDDPRRIPVEGRTYIKEVKGKKHKLFVRSLNPDIFMLDDSMAFTSLSAAAKAITHATNMDGPLFWCVTGKTE